MSSDTPLVTRNYRINGSPTTVALEPAFWSMLEEIAQHERITLNDLLQEVDNLRGNHPRASGIRVYTLMYFSTALRERTKEAGHGMPDRTGIFGTQRQQGRRADNGHSAFKCLSCIRETAQ